MGADLSDIPMPCFFAPEEQVEVVNGVKYRTFEGWNSVGCRIKRGEVSRYTSKTHGKMFSREQVYNLEESWTVAQDVNALSYFGE
jgi:hypothetical protein